MRSTNQTEKISSQTNMRAEQDKAKAKQAIGDYLTQLRQTTFAESDGRKTKRSPETVQRILKSARVIFIKDGHAGLSLRNVAEDAQMAVGNLTYHFPTKKALLSAVLDEALSDYIASHLALFGSDDEEPIEILMNIVEFYITNARDTHGFFYQLWGYAGSSEEARAHVRNLYRPIGRFIYYLVRAANPDLSDSEVRLVTLQLFSLEEGYKLFIGMGPDDDPALKNAEQDIRILTRRLVMGGARTEG